MNSESSGAEMPPLTEVSALMPGTTFDAEPPPRRIDYVWAGGGVRPVRAEVVRTTASDHHALLVEVELETSPG